MTDAIAKLLRSTYGEFYPTFSGKLPDQLCIHGQAGIVLGVLDGDGRPVEDKRRGPFLSVFEAGEWYLARMK